VNSYYSKDRLQKKKTSQKKKEEKGEKGKETSIRSIIEYQNIIFFLCTTIINKTYRY
jgi:hypothetical protein